MSGRRHGYGQHLLDGLQILRTRWVARPVRWVTKGATDRARIGRGVALAVVAWAAARIVLSSWKVLVVVVLVVVVLALRAATKAVKSGGGPAVGAVQEAPVEAVRDGLPDLPPGGFLELLHDVLGVAQAVHLRTLASALSARTGVVWEVADVRRLCEGNGVPVRPTVRAPGGGPTVGVHRDDLAAVFGSSPAVPAPAGVADYIAGQRTTTAATTPAPTTPATPTSTVYGGLRIVAVDDPDNPARTHVRVIDSARKKRA